METIFLKGAALAKEIKARISDQVATLASKGIRTKMVVILASNAPSALSYAEMKVKTAASLGITLQIIKMLSGLQNELNATLSKNANDPDVHGILLELPLAEGLNTEEALKLIPPHKDVDGLTFSNIGAIAAGREAGAIASATPLACIRLIESFVPISGKRVAVIGRGKTVGRPLVGLLLNRDATPTICHTKTPDLSEITHACDILIAASGHPNLITESHLKKRSCRYRCRHQHSQWSNSRRRAF